MKTECRVWAGDMRPGRLPGVCIVTGEPTGDTLNFRFSTSPSWTLLFIFLGLIPYVLAAGLTAKRAAGPLPVVQRKQLGIRVLRLGGWLTILAGILLFILAAVVSSPSQNQGGNSLSGILLLLGLLLIVGGIVGVIVRGFVGIKGRVEGAPGIPDNWVTLSGVHPAFADAVLRMYAERLAQGPQPTYYAQPYPAQPYQPPVYQPPSDAPLPPPPYTGAG